MGKLPRLTFALLWRSCISRLWRVRNITACLFAMNDGHSHADALVLMLLLPNMAHERYLNVCLGACVARTVGTCCGLVSFLVVSMTDERGNSFLQSSLVNILGPLRQPFLLTLLQPTFQVLDYRSVIYRKWRALMGPHQDGPACHDPFLLPLPWKCSLRYARRRLVYD